MNASRPFLSVAEGAERLNVSTKTLYRMIKRGELTAYKVGSQWRLSIADLEAYLARHRNAVRVFGGVL